MKHRKLNGIIIAITAILFSSCDWCSIARNYKRMTESPIRFPESIVSVPDGSLSIDSLQNDEIPKLVIWIDSTECSTCRIGGLSKYEGLYSQSQDSGFEFIVLFSPLYSEYSWALHAASRHRFPFPVYFDTFNEFGQINTIPSGKRFHSFLIDSHGKVIFIGDPCTSPRLNTLFEEVLNSINNNSN